MKRIIFFLASAALLLTGCAKEQVSNGVDGGLTTVTFTANVDGGVATKAVDYYDGNGANVNRCIMEIYFQNQLYKRMEKSMTLGVTTFSNVPVVAGKQYQILFWADCGGEELADKYYTTETEEDNMGLKAVTVNQTAFLAALTAGDNDKLDAFFGANDYTVGQTTNNNFDIDLHRPFAQLNVITTDVGTTGKTVTSADLLPDKVSVSYKAADVFNVATGAISSSKEDGSYTTYTYEADVYGTWSGEKTELTLSMDYLLASTEQGTVDVTFKTFNDGDENPVMNHSLTNLPYKRNYRTNVKGDLLTTAGSWTATIDAQWLTPDFVKAVEVADIKSANEIIKDNADKNLEVKFIGVPNDSGVPTGEQSSQYRAILTSPLKEGANLGIEVMTSTNTLYVGDYKTEYKVTGETVEEYIDGSAKQATVNINVPANSGIGTLIINAPSKTVLVNGHLVDNVGTITSIDAITSQNTLIIEPGQTVSTLTMRQGGLEIHGTVGTLEITEEDHDNNPVKVRTSENLSQTVFDVIYKAEDGVVEHDYIDRPDFSEKQNANGTWDIVPSVCKIGETGYGSLKDAIAAVPTDGTETIITMLSDFATTENVAIAQSQNVVLELNGKKISYTTDGHGSFIENMGQLKVQDSGSNGIITAEFSAPNWSDGCYTINNAGTYDKASKLVIESGTIENTSPAGLAWPVSNGVWGTYADLVINGGTIHSTNYVPVREYLQYGGKKTIVINGGKLISDNSRAIAIQLNDAAVADQGSYVEINGGEFSCNGSGILYVDLHAANLNTTGFTMTVNGGKFKNANADAPVLVYDNEGNDQSSAVLLSNVLKGGVYSKKPADEIVAECYISAENADEAYPWKVKLDAPEGAVAKINSTFYNSLQKAFDAVQNEQTIELLTDITVEPKGTSNSISNTSMTFNRSGISAVLDLGGHTINGDVTINKLLYVQKGNLSIRNGTIKHCYEEHGVYHTAIYIDNDASCPVITDLNINVSGTGIRLLSKARIGTLNAHIDSWVACKPSSGTTDFVCIYLSSADSKITEISGGYYASYMKNYVNSTSGTGAIYINNGTIQEISGGTFLGMYANGGTIRIDNGKIQKFSDGYVGFYEKTIDGQLCAFDKIDQITGGKFMSPQSSLENFERTKDQSSRVSALRAKVTSSGLLLVSKGEKVTVQNIKDGSSITMDVYEAVGNRLSIDGNGNPVSVQVKSGEKVIFPEEKTSVSGKKGFWFTASEGGEQVAYSPCALLNTSDRTLYFRLEDACLVTIKCPTYNNYVDVKSVSSGIVVRNNTGSSSQYMYVLKGEKISVVDYTLNEYTNSWGTYEMLGWKIDNQIENIEKNVEYDINKDVTVTFNSKKKQ